MGDTFGGWTAQEIEDEIFHGGYVPQTVLIQYINGDTDKDLHIERNPELADNPVFLNNPFVSRKID